MERADSMRFQLQDTIKFLDIDVNDAHKLSEVKVCDEKLKPIINEAIRRYGLKCDGCDNLLSIEGWLCIPHNRVEDIGWTIRLFCFDTRERCIERWMRTKK